MGCSSAWASVKFGQSCPTNTFDPASTSDIYYCHHQGCHESKTSHAKIHVVLIYAVLRELIEQRLEISWSQVLVDSQLLLAPASLRLLLDDGEPPWCARLFHTPALRKLPTCRRHVLERGWSNPKFLFCGCPHLSCGLLGQKTFEILQF